MATEEDTFKALQRAPLDQVDQACLDAFDMPKPFNAALRDTYSIEISTEGDFAMLLLILEHFHWTLKSYITQSIIDWSITEPLASNPELPLSPV